MREPAKVKEAASGSRKVTGEVLAVRVESPESPKVVEKSLKSKRLGPEMSIFVGTEWLSHITGE